MVFYGATSLDFVKNVAREFARRFDISKFKKMQIKLAWQHYTDWIYRLNDMKHGTQRISNLHCNYGDIIWSTSRLKSQASRMLVLNFVQSNNKENIKAPYY